MANPYAVGATITRHSGFTRDKMKIPTPTTTTVEIAQPKIPPRDFGIFANSFR